MSRAPLLGCIADDFTGATDLAGTLVGAGMRTVQMIGVPQRAFAQAVAEIPDGRDAPDGPDAIVVALKTRTAPSADAVEQSLAALRWLQEAGCRQFLFKYCSTFDSTDAGNIGPVIDALMSALGTGFTIACPAFPENRRTVFQGHLFVADRLLHESGMQNHPLTPMHDPDLVRVLQRQTTRKVGLLAHAEVSEGASAIGRGIDRLQAEGVEIAIVDAIGNDDLLQIGRSCARLPLVTGGSGIALGLPQNFRRNGESADSHVHASAALLPATPGLQAILSGSCSQATQGQVAHWCEGLRPAFRIDPLRLAAGDDVAGAALQWALPLLAAGPVLIHATADSASVRAAQASLGAAQAGLLVEAAMAAIAQALVAAGVRQLMVAGGETAGAVVSALGVGGLQIGPQIDPGVPWTVSLGAPQIALALKSGNFGSVDFFSKAWDLLA